MIINGQHYIIWVVGMDRPTELPRDCEYYTGYSWAVETPDTWDHLMIHRWPVSEAEYKTHHWCLANDVVVPTGYEVDRFGSLVEKGEHALMHTGDIYIEYKPSGFMLSPRPILKKIKPEIEYVTPTNQDIVNCIKATGTWPIIEVRDDESDSQWMVTTLIRVIFDDDDGYGFMDIGGTYWDDARMPVNLRDEWAERLKESNNE